MLDIISEVFVLTFFVSLKCQRDVKKDVIKNTFSSPNDEFEVSGVFPRAHCLNCRFWFSRVGIPIRTSEYRGKPEAVFLVRL